MEERYMRVGGTVPPGESKEFEFVQQMPDQVYSGAGVTDGGPDIEIEQVRIGVTLVHDPKLKIASTRDPWPVAVKAVVRLRNKGDDSRNVLVDIFHRPMSSDEKIAHKITIDIYTNGTVRGCMGGKVLTPQCGSEGKATTIAGQAQDVLEQALDAVLETEFALKKEEA